MTDMQSELVAFYADCEQRLAVCEAAGDGPWEVWPTHWMGGSDSRKYDGKNTIWIDSPQGEIMMIRPDAGRVTNDTYAKAKSVAASRNQRPGEIRALVKLAKALEAMAYDPQYSMRHLCENDGMGCLACENAEAALREILADWRAGQ